MKTADEIERELTEALGLKYEGPGLRHLIRKLAEREHALWQQLEAVRVQVAPHKTLDELASENRPTRRRGPQQTHLTPTSRTNCTAGSSRTAPTSRRHRRS